ncbi:MAG: SDR family oxidoreductase [Planctomycetaceae bacterium]|nr:SDR family oxidoreductase [Planctomycetaceae bacterium]
MSQETTLVTGPSSGIGRELARLFAADGSQLILASRDEAKLNDLANELREGPGVTVHVLPTDLSLPGASQQLFDRVAQLGLDVDVLVNNAGFGHLSRFWELPVETYTANLQVNVTAVTELTRLFLPSMLERGQGRILNVGSTASFQPGPNAAVYFATKAYVRFFSEALTEELRGTGVTVTCLCPGPTKTEFVTKADMQSAPLFQSLMDASTVARAGYRAMRHGKTRIITGWGNKLLAYSSKVSPDWIVRRVTQMLIALPKAGRKAVE